jgi:hypothetical protein
MAITITVFDLSPIGERGALRELAKRPNSAFRLCRRMVDRPQSCFEWKFLEHVIAR